MSLEPLQQVLKDLKQTQWQKEQVFGQLLATWSQIVGAAVAAQAQPIQITPRKVLLVATSSSAWAQNLAFERRRILNKLNAQVEHPFTDIRFSTSQWPRQSLNARHRSAVPPSITPTSLQRSFTVPKPEPTDPSIAFDRWTQAVQTRAREYSACPACHCPTPLAELQRWSVCNLCAVRANQEITPPSNTSNSYR